MMKINHCERFLSGKPYSLDEEGINNMLELVKNEKGYDTYVNAKNSLVKTLDTKASMDDLNIYITTCNL